MEYNKRTYLYLNAIIIIGLTILYFIFKPSLILVAIIGFFLKKLNDIVFNYVRPIRCQNCKRWNYIFQKKGGSLKCKGCNFEIFFEEIENSNYSGMP